MKMDELDKYTDLAAKAFTAYLDECKKYRDDLDNIQYEDLPHEFALGWLAAVKEIERIINENQSETND